MGNTAGFGPAEFGFDPRLPSATTKHSEEPHMGNLHVVVGGLYGSEGKGAAAAHLCHPDRFSGTAVRVGGSQAGHTAYDSQGRRWPLRHIPVAAVVNPYARLVIAAGSEVDLEVLNEEITTLEDAGHQIRHRLIMDRSATVITDTHKQIERGTRLTDRLGSTAKGVGAARSERIMRTAHTIGHHQDQIPAGVTLGDTSAWLTPNEDVLIEGVQGYGLGLHTPYYPYTTSSDCCAIDFLAMAGVTNPAMLAQPTVWVVFRPYPIRVAGNSGPMNNETSWEALGLPPETTTVTGKTRRVGRWDPNLAMEAVFANGGPHPQVKLALTMADQIDPGVRGITRPDELTPAVAAFIHQIETGTKSTGQLQLVGTSPQTVVDLQSLKG